MKRMPFIILAMTALVLLAATAQAGPTRAVLYPNRADILDQIRLTPQYGSLSFIIPIQADPQSVSIDLPDTQTKATNLAWRKIKPEETEHIKALRAGLEQLEDQRAAIAGGIEAIEAQQLYWTSKDGFRAQAAAEAVSYAAAMAKSMKRLAQEKHPLERQLKEKEREVKEAKDKLAKSTAMIKEAWEISATMTKEINHPVDADIRYILHGCGWKPVYRLDARPAQSALDFLFQAEITQGTGLDWQKTDLALSTLAPSSNLNPPHMRPWIIRPMRVMAKSRMVTNEMTMDAAPPMPMAAPMEAAFAGSAEPVMESKATYAIWEMGKKYVPAGETIRMPVISRSYKADFSWLLRPGLTKKSFLRAKIEPGKTENFPSGQALYLVDGSLLAKKRFSMESKDKTIFFGSDPTVTSKINILNKESGESGFIGKKQTYVWDYEIIVENHKPHPVPIRVEEPKPQRRDEHIELETDFTPTPEEKENVYYWTADTPAKGKTKIHYKVQLTAPEDMNLDLGWKR